MGSIIRLASQLLFLLIISLVVASRTNAQTTSSTQETILSASDVLLKLFEETGGLRWNSRVNWLQDEQVCNYQGITCYNTNDASDALGQSERIGHIKEINLSDNHLVGVIPSQVFTDLPYLETLILRDNVDLVVNMPTSSYKSNLLLRHLDISNTNTQSIYGLGDPWLTTSLETLHMNDLALTGPIPDAIYQLTRLTALYANNNRLSGSISPTGLATLSNLQELYLRNNDLSGSIPTTIGLLTNLKILVLAQNPSLQGAIPTEIESCIDLEILALERSSSSTATDDTAEDTVVNDGGGDLDYTYIYGGTDASDVLSGGLTGPVPALANMRNLQLVTLQNHKLSGPLPSNFMSSANSAGVILEIDLSNNDVTGSIPTSLANKERVNLYITGNKLSSLGDVYATSSCANIPNWINAAVSRLGCNAIACPIGYYAPNVGRATSSTATCTVCESSIYMGQTSCSSSSTGAGSGTGTTSGNGTSTTTTTVAMNQRAFLISFFNKMSGRYWRNSDNWLNPASHECTWFGIECNDDKEVTHIALPNNGLTNTVPSDIFLLSQLVALDFSSNSIGFSFDGIENAKKLQKLYLVQSDLDSIDGIGSLAQTNSIKQLALASNYLQGSPPDGLFDLTSLEELDISHNRFTGALSTRIGQLTNLVRLEMFGNRFSGQLPGEIGNLIQLEEFMAAGNGFSGVLPTQLENLVKLKTLSLRQTTTDAKIGGNLLALPNLAQLTSLQLDGNALEGTLPTNMLQETSRGSDRIELLLSNNNLQGEIPASWASRFRQLVVDLSGNEISSFGSGVCSQTSWMDGTVAAYQCNAILCPKGTYNEFGRQTSDGGDCRSCPQVQVLGSRICYAADGTPQGPTTTSEKELAILKEFFTATHGYNWVKSDGWSTSNDYCSWYGVGCSNQGHVERIYMESNGLTGQPPTSLFDLTELQELTLKDNVINFSFDGIGKATKLSKLDLTGSSIDSVAGLDQATNLITLILDFNDLAGSFPTEFLQLKNLRYLSASFNKLEGRLPTDFTLLSALETLTLYHNRFSGPLPAAIGSLVNLKVLGLSENNFDGEIPLEFNNLVNLETLAIQREGGTDVGNVGIYQGSSEDIGTGLTGPLPAFDKLTNLRQLFLGVNSLSGEIPANFLGSLDNSAAAVIDITSNRLTGGLPASLARFEQLSFYAAGNQLTLEVPDGLCFQNDWMNGQVAMFECNAILCPPNTYRTNFGRQTASESTCQSCESGTSTPYYGSFKCMSTQEKQVMSELAVLADLYQALDGDGWRLNDYWLDPDISVCEWHGITCSAAGSVESIHLMQNGLVGNVPSSIYELPNLKEINFASNSGIVMTFDGIQDASRLEFLNIGEIGLKSLDGVGQAPALSLLHAPGNDFNNVFPAAVLNIASLEVLDLSNNAVGSTLPSGISDLGNLIVFSCSKCGLAGQFPQFIGNMQQLEFLDLSFNEFNGTLPASIESLSNLKHFDLSSQSSADNIGGLSGNLPSFAAATQLTEVYLQKNSFTGSIPSTFLSAMDGTVPVTVDLRSNQLNGTIPEALSKFQVADFYAADNMISAIPSTLCALQWNGKSSAETSCDFILCEIGGFNGIGRATVDLPCEICTSADYLGTTWCGDAERDILQKMFFDLDGFDWTNADGWGSSSSVCTWYGVTCHTGDLLDGLVKTLDLRDNNLAGTLSERIWLLAQMTDLDLSDNTGLVIPNFARLADASSLQNLKLSKTQVNSLSGIGSSNSLISFHCTSCNIAGPIPDELYNLGLLESLFLNYNAISGQISGQIRSLTKLKELYLFSNKLDGTIPEDLGRLENAEVISLGQNLLTGEIPYLLSFMPKLRVLSLEKEKVEVVAMFTVAPSGLRGDLPDFGRAPNLRELYLGSNSLQGTIPPHFLAFANKSEAIRVDLSHNVLHSTVPAELAKFEDLRLFVGGNQISDIAPEVCEKKEWMNGLMAAGCDAFLCPPGTFNEYGRRVVTEDCEVCNHNGLALYYGSTSCSAIFPELRPEFEMLDEFFDIAGGVEWTNKTNWKAEGVSVCSWFGVTCETIDGRETVTEISLPNNNLSGRVGSIVFYLPSLRVLNVANNKVTVSFRDIGDAISLQELDLTATEVTSLKGVSAARNLQVLKMGSNAFNGESIPDELYSLSALRILDISQGGFMGEISSSIGDLNKLEMLTANKNYLGGQIPGALGKLSLLTKLDLSDNMFFGDLPSSVQRLTKLEFLGIGARNQPSLGLSGMLYSFSNLTSLIHLDLGGNLLTGTVPGDFLVGVTDPTAVITVLLDSNLLHGQLPPSLSRFTRLNLDITDNKIESIASELCEMRFWNDGDVGRHDCDGLLCPAGTFNSAGRQDSEDNRCEECPGQETDRYLGQSICPSLRKESAKIILNELYSSTGGENWKKRDGWTTNPDICTWHGIKCINDVDVEEINLGGNNLAGPIPKSIFKLPGLKNLLLYSNPIKFSFDGVENASSLMSLQLDSTGLTSLAGIGKAPILTYLDARFNALEGHLPDEIDQLVHLETLLLTENKLNGPLPTFESNRRLITVRLAENAFVGPLPSFAVHPSMRNLDVSDNELRDSIPEDLFAAVESTTAIFLDLSGNNFSGTVPASLSRFVDATIYVRDNKITGIPTELCKQERWNSGDVGRYSCDALLCPPLSFNPGTGRASDTNGDCQACPWATFYGHSQCTAGMGSSASIFVLSRLFATVVACSSAMALLLAIL